eukprot:TRINITY_DN1575_c0_g1_i1.p1 TRINITY_DN1575_c0_g1~~TRINITY_DN1575_c0_g1_i1.p1  ORF type:complete len:150 (-),score=15.44 TRINITY_DN1575_c0_g1_i1:207-656(-)
MRSFLSNIFALALLFTLMASALASVVQVPKPEDFHAILQQHLNDPCLFVYVIGARDQEGNSWCGDTQRADPLVKTIIHTMPECTIIEAPVQRAEYKHNSAYPYRVDPHLQIVGVPTLIHWTKDGPGQRLTLGEIEAEPLKTLRASVQRK